MDVLNILRFKLECKYKDFVEMYCERFLLELLLCNFIVTRLLRTLQSHSYSKDKKDRDQRFLGDSSELNQESSNQTSDKD